MLSTILLQAAQGAAPSGGIADYSGLIMIVALIAIFYFFMIRPQQQKQKKINEFRSSLKKGDKVMTAGGIYGRIVTIKDSTVILEVADGVRITIDKAMIYQTAQEVAETGAEPGK